MPAHFPIDESLYSDFSLYIFLQDDRKEKKKEGKTGKSTTITLISVGLYVQSQPGPWKSCSLENNFHLH